MNLSTATDFPSLYAEYISIEIFSSHYLIDLLQNSPPLFTHILFNLWLDLSKSF